MSKSAEAFRTISEVAVELAVPKHVLRFWEGKFPQIRPMKRGGGRRYYRPQDVKLLQGIRQLLHSDGYTIKGVQKILREQGVDEVKSRGQPAKAVDADETDSAGKSPLRQKSNGVAPEVKSKRNSTKGAAGKSDAAKRPSASPAAGPGKPLDSDDKAIVKAAIAELESCRKLLGGMRSSQSGGKHLSNTAAARPKKRA